MATPVCILAIDPGTTTGYATAASSGTWDVSPRKARKRPVASPAEPECSRCGKLARHVQAQLAHILRTTSRPVECDDPRLVVVVEGAAAFQRGKAAVRVSHELRGAVKTVCYDYRATYVEVQPQDLKRFACGRANADKDAMIAAARKHLGYKGNDDNEADAIWLYAWARKYAR